MNSNSHGITHAVSLSSLPQTGEVEIVIKIS